jgi:CelD/BcsL family acetyltransferase involved in cellulose biosynthesis
MKIRTVKIEQLTGDEVTAWSAIQRSEPELASPFFRPEFAQAVAATRNDVEVAILEEEGRPVGFLPYQRSQWNVGRPVGGNLSDYHGLIAPAGASCDLIELLNVCGLRVWHFDHLPFGQPSFAPFVCRSADSSYIDLPDSSEDYFALRENGRRLKSEFGQKMRKLEREIGPLRFVADARDPQFVSKLIAWKSAKFHRMNTPNIFEYAWVRKLLENILAHESNEFSHFLSVLYAGDTIASIHFGIRSGTLLHGWFPAYNVELARYSPGILHWLETIKAARSIGIRRIDLGKGREAYKHRLATGATKIAEGAVDVKASAAAVRRAWWHTRECIRSSPLATHVDVPTRILYRMKHWLGAR